MFTGVQMLKNNPHASRPAAFSLVELLVVISIVAVLLALVLPSLRRSREIANAMSCASNLRQQAVATHVYVQDQRDGALPWTQRFSSGWGIRLTPYLGNPYIAGLNSPESNGYFGPLFNNYPVFRCPENRLLRGSLYYYWNYGYNGRLTSGVTTGNAGQQALAWVDRRTMPRITYNPSKIVMTGDCYINTMVSLGEFTTNLTVSSGPRVHMQDKVNMQMLDGHVELLERGQRTDLTSVDKPGTSWQ